MECLEERGTEVERKDVNQVVNRRGGAQDVGRPEAGQATGLAGRGGIFAPPGACAQKTSPWFHRFFTFSATNLLNERDGAFPRGNQQTAFQGLLLIAVAIIRGSHQVPGCCGKCF